MVSLPLQFDCFDYGAEPSIVCFYRLQFKERGQRDGFLVGNLGIKGRCWQHTKFPVIQIKNGFVTGEGSIETEYKFYIASTA